MALTLEELGIQGGSFQPSPEEQAAFNEATGVLPESRIRELLLSPSGARFDILRNDIARAGQSGGLDLLNLDSDLEPTLDGFTRGSAGEALSTFSRFRNLLGIPRPGRSAIGRLSARQLEKPEETPGFKLAQNLLTEKSQARRENINEIIRRSGLGGTFSGPGLEKLLQPFERETDIALGNLGLEAGKQAEDRSLDILRLGETSFQNELRTAQATEELSKNRQLQRELADQLLKAGLGTAAGQLLAKGVPGLIDFISELLGSNNAQDRSTGQTAASIVQRAIGGLGRSIFGGGEGGGGTAFNPIKEFGGQSLLDFEDADFFGDIFGGGGGDGGGGGFDLFNLGEFDDFGSFFSDFSNAGTGAAGVGGDIAAGIPNFVDPFELGDFSSLAGMIEGEGGAAGGLIGMGGLSGALIAAGIPLSIVLGMLPFLGQRKEIEKAKEKGFAQSYLQQIQSDPQAWVTGLEQAWGPRGRQIGEAALQGKINSMTDLLDVIGEKEFDASKLAGLSQWATQYTVAPGEQWYSPMLIESNRDQIDRFFKDPQHALQEFQEDELQRLGLYDSFEALSAGRGLGSDE